MPTVMGIPLIGFIQICLGTAAALFCAVMFALRPKKNKAGEYIIKNVHIITGDGSELHNRNVYIKKGVIAEISESEIIAKNVQVIDGSGKTLMPGIIDSHIHVGGMNCKSPQEIDVLLRSEMPRIFSENILPYGITTVKDLDAPKHFIKRLQNEIKAGKITAPELVIVGPNFTAPKGHPASTLGRDSEWLRGEIAIPVTSAEDVTKGIDELKKLGVDFLKFTYQGGDFSYYSEIVQIEKIDKALMEQIIKEGREKGFKATAHVFCENDVRELLEAGIYGIEHGILDRKLSPDDDIIILWKKSGAHFVPTVNAMTYEPDPNRLIYSMHNLKVLHDAGIFISMGTDSMLEIMSGDVQHRELQYYVEAGLTPMEAIVMATKNSAEHLGIADRKGTVAVGKEADLILLDKNPVEDISYTRFIDKVFLKGRVVFSQKEISSYEMPEYAFPEGRNEYSYISADGKIERTINTEKYASEGVLRNTTKQDGEVFASEEIKVNSALSANEWTYSRPSDGTELHAVREDGIIHLTGTFNGKPQDKRLNIGEGLWYQFMDINMAAFVKSEHKEILFYSIGTGNNRGAMGLGEFAAKKLGEESVAVDGKTYEAVKVSFVLTMFAWAWTGIYHYDKNTGMLLQSGEKKGTSFNITSKIKQ